MLSDCATDGDVAVESVWTTQGPPLRRRSTTYRETLHASGADQLVSTGELEVPSCVAEYSRETGAFEPRVHYHFRSLVGSARL